MRGRGQVGGWQESWLCHSSLRGGQRAENDPAPSSRWKALKAQLIAERTKLGNYADLKQFYRDLEDLEEWISEMLPTACDESYKDPTNIQASSK